MGIAEQYKTEAGQTYLYGEVELQPDSYTRTDNLRRRLPAPWHL